MEITTAFVLLQIVLIANSNSSSARSTVYYYISAGDWERGFNLFSIAAIVILLSKTAMLVIGLRFLLTICATFSGSKGKTIFRLIANVILYVALIFFLIKVFEYLGFSPATIVAGIGSLGLAISLGAQNFVADIFAGLTLLFEGTVHVGDNVKIAVTSAPEYQGKIVEVGIRRTKLLTREGDLVTCSNKDIKTIKNRTQLNSLVICEVVVSSSISADDLGQMLERELSEIGRTDRQILSGPAYNGITSIGNGTMTLSVSAECSEENYSYVRDKLNVSLQRIFTEHGFSI
jgi:small conductance mechanosensitive channel